MAKKLTLTDYLTLQDQTKRIQSGFIDLDFKLPEDFVTGAKLAKPVLSFRFQAHTETRLQVTVNRPHNPHVLDITFGATNFVRMYHEFIPGRVLEAGEENNIGFTVASLPADISIGGVLLMFQRRIDI